MDLAKIKHLTSAISLWAQHIFWSFKAQKFRVSHDPSHHL